MMHSGTYFDDEVGEARHYSVDPLFSVVKELPTRSGIYGFRAVGHSRGTDRSIYVGQAQNMRKRVRNHFSACKRKSHGNPILQRIVDKYGAHQLEIILFEECPVAELDEREQNWIDYFNDIHPGMLINTLRKVDSPRRGVKPSNESKLKTSLSMKGKTRTPEEIEKSADARRGARRTAQQCLNISRALTGKICGPQTVEEIEAKSRRAKKYFHSLSDEQKKQFSLTSKTNVAKTQTPEARAKHAFACKINALLKHAIKPVLAELGLDYPKPF